MKLNKLKLYIEENLIGKSGRQLSATKIKKINTETLKEIIEVTNYLPEDSDINIRCYNIVKKLDSIPKCICGKERKFYNFNNGYKTSCGSSSCAGKLSATKIKETQKRNFVKNNSTKVLNISTPNLILWIKDNLLSNKGFKNAKLSPKSKFYNDNIEYINTIFDKTKYLQNTNISQSIYNIINNISNLNEIPKCKTCSKPSIYHNYNNGYRQYCSFKCSRNKNTYDKVRKTTNERYGVDYILQNEEFKSKVFETKNNKSLEEKEETSSKRKQTNLERYGVDNYFKSEVMVEDNIINLKSKFYHQALLDYSDKNISILSTLDDYLNDKEIKYKCNKCNNIHKKDYLKRNGLFFRCETCLPYHISLPEVQVLDIVKEQDHEACNTRKVIAPLELDIYSKKFKFAIEYNGIMWHSIGKSDSSKFNNHTQENIIKNKHLNKTNLCEEQDIQLYHIFENEWEDQNKREIYKSMINNAMNVNDKLFARKCIVKEVQNKESKEFLENNHLQGNVNSSVKLGLYYKDELYSLMTLGLSRYNKEVQYELIRFCTKKGYTIVGGASKLLKYFERNYNPKSIISYANRRWSRGNLYKKLGFDFIRNTTPNYFYFKKGKRNILESRVKYQKHKLKDILEDFDSKLTESDNMYNNNFRKIYDSGNKVYIKYYS